MVLNEDLKTYLQESKNCNLMLNCKKVKSGRNSKDYTIT
jgi:hypothetical protein